MRLLTLIGTGGIGKTRLAVQVASDLAHDYANSVCFVSLAPISDSNLVIPTIAQALGFGETEDLSLFEHLKASLYEKQFLLLLDNFEQVAAAAPLVAELLAACPQVKIVVTSREALRIYGEYEFPVPPLALPDPKHLPEITYLSHYAAIALFIQRAQAIKPDFHMTDTTARAIAEICIRLDGLPLAIELAAARIKLLPPEILLTRLKRRLHVLISGKRDAPERHQTLRNTMKWSYDLLNADEQRLFRELGNKRGIALSLLQLAELLFAAQGDQTRVRSLLEEGFALCRDLGDKDAIAYSYSFSGQVALSEGDAFTARSLLEESLALYKDMGDRQRTAQSLSSLAKVATIQGDNATARALYEESLAFARVGHKLNIACGLEGLASVIAAQAEPSRAAQLWGAAEALRETIGAPIPPIERAGYDRAVAAVRVDLGEKVFAARWAEGRSMAPEQALAMQGGAVMSSPISVKQSSTPSTKPPATYPDELTAREVDVLRLVAMGLTDVQVAEKLTISPRTVNAHLTSIYSKIHISSRSAATRYAIEQHLV